MSEDPKAAPKTGGRPADDCFALPPGVDWTPVDEALALLRERMTPVVAAETIPIEAAAGRYLSEDVAALRPHPACDNAAVDGYAFAHPGEQAERSFKLVKGRAAAGAPWDGALKPGEALRILTGAPMPDGADTVALQEDAAETAPLLGSRKVALTPPKKPGANRRKAGENIQTGDRVAQAGDRVTPARIAQLAAAGLSELPIYAPLRVAVVSSGSELIQPGVEDDPAPEFVIDSNKPMLRALAETTGAQISFIATAGDAPRAVAQALDLASGSADVIVTSGGASGGDEDHLSAALAQAAEDGRGLSPDQTPFHLWRIAMKPGRPLAMGLWNGAPTFGLPGNPVAAFVCFLIFVRPALIALGGGAWSQPRPLLVESGFDHPKKPGRREYLRVRLGEDGRLEKYRSEGSGLIDGLIWADGLADLAHDAGPVKAGDRIAYLPFSGFGVPG